MKKGQLVKLKAGARNAYKVWDKGEVVEVFELDSTGLTTSVLVKDNYDNFLTVRIEKLEELENA